MPSSSLPRSTDQGVLTGIVVAAATAGALVGFGRLSGTPVALFNAIAAVLIGEGAQGIIRFEPLVTPLGILAHWGVATAWSVAYVFAVRRGGSMIAMAAACAVADFLVATVLARFLGVGLGIGLPLGQRIVFALVLAVSLALGMRLARLPANRGA